MIRKRKCHREVKFKCERILPLRISFHLQGKLRIQYLHSLLTELYWMFDYSLLTYFYSKESGCTAGCQGKRCCNGCSDRGDSHRKQKVSEETNSGICILCVKKAALMHERWSNPGFREQEIEEPNMRRKEGRKADNEEETRRYRILWIQSEAKSNSKNKSVLVGRLILWEKKRRDYTSKNSTPRKSNRLVQKIKK